MRKLFAALAVCLLFSTATAEATRRRSVRIPSTPVISDDTPAGWLAAHAFTLRATSLTSDTSDLAPLRTIVGDADVVGLGDGTHGTSEFYTVKLRLIDYLVRELGFDVISFELSFARADQLNAYVQGGPGDPRALLREAGRLGYFFWDAEEIVEVVEWMRQYNAHRGSRPAVQIAGADIWDPRASAQAVVTYLGTVDPAAADAFESDYACVLALTGIFPLSCPRDAAEAAYQRLAGRAADLGAGAGAAAYETALQNARAIVQSFSFGERDDNMAVNVRWLREQRSETGRVVYWAHSEHVGKIASAQTPGGSAGTFLKRDLGAEYVAIGTTTGSGQYMTWVGSGPSVRKVPVPESGTYEVYFQLGARPAILIPLRGSVPAWVAEPARYFFAGTGPLEPPYLSGSLTEKLDAIIYIHATTPIHPIAP
jgi:erythromycin esterase